MTTQAEYIAAARAAGLDVADDGRTIRGGISGVCWCNERASRRLPLTGAMLSQSGLGNFNAGAEDADGFLAASWNTDAAVAGAWLQIDLGVPVRVSRIWVRQQVTAPNTKYRGIYAVEWSDNASAWTQVDSFRGSGLISDWLDPSPGVIEAAWPYMSAEFHIQGSHRYWRLRLTNTPGPQNDISGLLMWFP